MKFSIRWIIIIASIVLVWGTHLIITPSSYIMSEKVLTRHMQDIMENIADLTLEQAYNHLNKARSAASLAKQLLSSNVVSSEISGSASLERYFFDQLSIYPHLSGIYVGGLNGNFFMVSRHAKHSTDGFRTKIIRHHLGGRSTELVWRDSDFKLIEKKYHQADNYDPRQRPWFKKVVETMQICWTDPYLFYTAQKPGVTIAGPSFDRQGHLKGIVGVDIEISELSNFVSKLRVGKSGKAFIMNENGDMIAFHDPTKLVYAEGENQTFRLTRVHEIDDDLVRSATESVPWQRDAQRNMFLAEPIFSSFNHDGETYMSMFTPFPEKELPWIIGVYLPEEDYLGIIKRNRRLNLFITIALSLLASGIGLFLAEKIIAPVESITKEAKAIEDLDLKTDFRVESRFNELQAAADAFADMKYSLIGCAGKLLESESVYRAIAKTANDAIIMMDHEHKISFFNPAAEKMFGYTEKEACGNNLHQLLAPRHQDGPIRKGLDHFVRSGMGHYIDRTVNVTAVNKAGHEFPVELSLSSVQVDDNWHAVAIIRNITERKKAEQLRKRLADDLHDGLGGSLTNIKLFAEMTKTFPNGDITQKNLDAIAEICEDCIDEIRNYMNILNEPDPNWQDLDAELNQYCAKTLEPHKITFSKSSSISPDAPPPSRLLYINIKKIIKEAVTNVIKHSNGTSMLLDFRVAPDCMQLMVVDDGTGGQTMQSSGRGLLSMKSRAKEMGASFDIYWSNGVKLVLSIPFSNQTVRHDPLADG